MREDSAIDDPKFLSDEQEETFTNWAREPSLKALKADLDNSKTFHDAQVNKIKIWDDYRNGAGIASPKSGKGQSKVQPKLIRKQAEWRYAALSEPFLSTPDLFKVSPRTWEDKQGAIQNELVLNMQFTSQINRVALIDEFIRTGVDEGTVFLRTGWDYLETTETIQKPVYEYAENPAIAQVYAQMEQLDQTNPVMLLNAPQELQDGYTYYKETGQVLQFIPVGMEEVEQVKVLRNQPTVEVCKTANLFIDPSCNGNLKKANYAIYSFTTSLAELKAEGRYKNLEKVNVSGTSPITDPNFTTNGDPNFQPADRARKRIIAYEYWGYWDIDGSGTLSPFVATWVGDQIIRMEANPFPDGEIPFVGVSYLPVRKSIYGEPDAELLKDNQDILGAVTRGMIDLLGKSANSQTGFAKNMLDSTNKRNFEEGKNYEFNPGSNPQMSIFTHTFPEIPSSAQYLLALMNNDAESLTGVKAFSNTGIDGSSLGQTATGVRGALDASSKREMGILRRFSDGLIEVAKKVIAMNAVWLSEEEIVRVTEEEFTPVRRDDLKGDYDLRLTISTAEADEQQAQDLAFMLQTLGNNMDFGMTQMILGEIARLRKMPDLQHKIISFKPEPDPVQEQIKQMQIELLQAQINLTNAQAMEASTKGVLNDTKRGVETSRANQIQSVADKNNLDFLQNQEGVKHQQQLELANIKSTDGLMSEAMKAQYKLDELKLKHRSGLLTEKAKASLQPNKTNQ